MITKNGSVNMLYKPCTTAVPIVAKETQLCAQV